MVLMSLPSPGSPGPRCRGTAQKRNRNILQIVRLRAGIFQTELFGASLSLFKDIPCWLCCPSPFWVGSPPLWTHLHTGKIPFKIKPYILGLFIIIPEIFGGFITPVPLPAVPLCVQEFRAQLGDNSHYTEFSPGVFCISSFLNFPSQRFHLFHPAPRSCAGLDPQGWNCCSPPCPGGGE